MIRLEPKIEVKISPDNKVYISWTWLVNGEEDWLKAVSEVFTYLTQEEVNHEYAQITPHTFRVSMEIPMDELYLMDLVGDVMASNRRVIENFLSTLYRLNLFKKLVLEEAVKSAEPVELKWDAEEEIRDYVSRELGQEVKSVEFCVSAEPAKITKTEEGLVVRANPLSYQYDILMAVERFRRGEE